MAWSGHGKFYLFVTQLHRRAVAQEANTSVKILYIWPGISEKEFHTAQSVCGNSREKRAEKGDFLILYVNLHKPQAYPLATCGWNWPKTV